MSGLEGVPSRALALELTRRSPALLMRTLRRRLERSPPPQPLAAETIGFFERPSRPPLPLWRGYRDTIKPGWRHYYWQVKVLFDLAARVQLPDDAERLREGLLAAPSLPVRLDELTRVVELLAGRFPELVRPVTLQAEGCEIPRLAVAPSETALRAKHGYYRAVAEQLLAVLTRQGVNAAGSRLLEIGCGTGYMTFALASVGAAEVIGADLRLGPGRELEREELRRRFLGAKAGRVELLESDAAALPLADGSIDAAISVSTFEHLREPAAVLAELSRVLRPGGIAYHTVDPWFGPAGGHSVCTLDSPWAHVRLTPDEFEQYLNVYRPHERDAALHFYRTGFQIPRLTLAQTEALAIASGFEIADWQDSRQLFANHLPHLDAEMLNDCARTYPAVTARDLATSVFTMALRRR